MYKLVITSKFSAAHRLVNYPGMCAQIHGHNWTVKVIVAAEDVDENGMVVDLVEQLFSSLAGVDADHEGRNVQGELTLNLLSHPCLVSATDLVRLGQDDQAVTGRSQQ